MTARVAPALPPWPVPRVAPPAVVDRLEADRRAVVDPPAVGDHRGVDPVGALPSRCLAVPVRASAPLQPIARAPVQFLRQQGRMERIGSPPSIITSKDARAIV